MGWWLGGGSKGGKTMVKLGKVKSMWEEVGW